MFPCWDEPVFRATFDVSAVLPEKFLALSNMPIERETSSGDGLKLVAFERTPPMATYLVAFAAGELGSVSAESEGVMLRVLATDEKQDQGRYALEAARKLLAYYTRYFQINYPLPKLDLIAVPGGFGGAMENWRAITFEESDLLFDPAGS
jgi:aminopeptidase N